MLKHFKTVMTFGFAAMLIAACGSTDEPLKKLEKLTDRIEKNADNFTDEEWDEVASEMEEIQEEMADRKYTEEELREIGRLKGRCFVRMTKKAMKDASETFDDLSKQLEGGIDGFLEEMSKDED